MKRTLGRSGIEVSAIGMGCWAIGGLAFRGETPIGWGEVDDAESARAIRAALDAGVSLFDTADVYGAGHSERVLGSALGADRKNVAIASKFSNVFDEETKQVTGSDSSPDYIRRACDASLARLGTDYIDLYQFHNGGFAIEQADDVLEALERLVDAGKIRSYGWSTDDPDRARKFATGEHCAAAQFQMNVLSDAPEMVRACEELGLAGLNRGPLAMGLLSGKYDASSTLGENDVRGPNAPGWMRYFSDGRPSPEFMKRLDAIREVLTADGRNLAQGALGWLLARSPVTVPIPGFRTVEQVEQNAATLEKGPLTGEQMERIAELLQ